MPKASRLSAAVAASAAAALTLTACGSESSSDSSSSSSSSAASDEKTSSVSLAEPKPEDTKKVEEIEVSPAKGKKGPSVDLPDKPLSVSETTLNVLKEGSGEQLADDAYATVDLAMFSGKDGKIIQGSETYTNSPIVLDLGNQGALPGLVKSIKGQKVGSHGVSVMPPKDLFGDQGMPDYGVDGKDNLVLVYDVRGVLPDQAEGTEKKPASGLPEVSWKADAPAEITIPKDAEKPKKLVTETLIEGDGKTIKNGDNVYVSYTGATWEDGKVFDSSMQDGRGPFSFPVGQKRVIPGWDKAVEGAKVGSRLMLVVPPKEGYGKEGTPDGSIKPDSTLVFVIDILGAP